jgi:hypothetical protein
MSNASTLGEDEKHVLGVGQIVTNLQALEFLLRLFLSKLESGGDRSKEGPNPLGFKVGDRVPVNALTNYDSLAEVVRKYNDRVGDSAFRVDPSVVDLRDAFAHGRVLARQPRRPLHLIKLARPEGDAVTVTTHLVLTDDWIASTRARLAGEIAKAHAAVTMLESG